MFCFIRPDWGEHIILDLRILCNGIHENPLIASMIMNAHVVSDLLGYLFEKQIAKANKSECHLSGKTSSVSLL